MSEIFRSTTDRLTNAVTLADLASEIGVSHGLIRQARLNPSSSAYRTPPKGWERAVSTLARRKASELLMLAEALDANMRANVMSND